MKNSKHPFLPLSRVSQGQHFELFEAAFDDHVSVRPQNIPVRGSECAYN